MTLTSPPIEDDPTLLWPSDAAEQQLLDDEPGAEGDDGEPEKVVRVPLVGAAALLSGGAGAFLAARLFTGTVFPLAVALVGVAIGVGVTFVSYRSPRAARLQYFVIPIAAVVGAGLVAPEAGGGSANLPSLIVEAVRQGGLTQPPVPFDPGWRFVLVVLFAAVTAAGMALAVNAARPRLAVMVPMPVVLGTALIQPEGSEVVASVVAMVLMVGALAVAYGADLASEGIVGGGFEVRRLGRGAALLVVIVALLVVVSQTDFLFPEADRDQVIPPQKPPVPPPEPDRVLFTVESTRSGPWRVGVLDVYGQDAFLLPPVDPELIVDVPDGGTVARPPAGRETYTALFTIADVKGHTLPASPSPTKLTGTGERVEYDTRSQVFRLGDTRVPRGFRYTVTAPVPPDSKELAAAPKPPALLQQEFTALPPAPPGVAALLAAAPTTNNFDRLQFVRQGLYDKVVAAGAGKPVDILPAKVDSMLAGGEATPFEITAAEVMLARWAGIPARLGFGFYGGEASAQEGELAFRPKHGAAWLETYFEGYGWVPILGTPPRAKASLSNEQKNDDPRVVATEELAVTVYVPVRFQSVRLLYELVRYWLKIVVPILLGLATLIAGYPALFKLARTRRRRRWARDHGPVPRIVVAYAEFRDKAYDLNVGDVSWTPLEFTAATDDDDEHAELAWLVSRSVWGDLGRDLRIEDVEAAEDMARSLTKRLASEQTGLNRLLAWISRTSLRDPYTDEVPNLWPRRKRGAFRRAGVRSKRWWQVWKRSGGRRLAPATLALVALLVAVVPGCGRDPASASEVPSALPKNLVPATLGDFRLQREPQMEKEYAAVGKEALVSGGRVFTIRDGEDAIQGTFQAAVFKEEYDGTDRDVQESVEKGLGSGRFETTRYGSVRLRTLELAEQRMFLWFPPERNVMELWVMRKSFDQSDAVVRAMIDHQRGWDT